MTYIGKASTHSYPAAPKSHTVCEGVGVGGWIYDKDKDKKGKNWLAPGILSQLLRRWE